MYKVKTTRQFEKDLKLCAKRGFRIEMLYSVVNLLKESGSLPAKYKPHKLSGQYKGCWECHIQSDWLLIWQQNDEELILLFTNTGTHSDLF